MATLAQAIDQLRPEFGFAFDEDANSDPDARMLITIPDHATITINYENKEGRRVMRYKTDMVVIV